MEIKKMQAEMDGFPNEVQVQKLGNTLYEIIQNRNVIKDETSEHIIYRAETVIQTVNITTRSEAIVAFIRMKYSQDDEFALINKGILSNQNQEYVEYLEYVALCKERVSVYFKL
jgi:hypothetical protein